MCNLNLMNIVIYDYLYKWFIINNTSGKNP
jgi:hypothetical protein